MRMIAAIEDERAGTCSGLTMLLTILTLAVSIQAGRPQEARERPDQTPTTLTGCIQQTGDPTVFLLAVPGIAPPHDIGAGGREREREGEGAGKTSPENPSAGRAGERGRAAGDAVRPAPTMENRSYKLVDVDAARLKSLIGHAVEVRGQLSPAENDAGSPGDTKDGRTPTNPTFHAKEVTQVADSCTTLMRGK